MKAPFPGPPLAPCCPPRHVHQLRLAKDGWPMWPLGPAAAARKCHFLAKIGQNAYFVWLYTPGILHLRAQVLACALPHKKIPPPPRGFFELWPAKPKKTRPFFEKAGKWGCAWWGAWPAVLGCNPQCKCLCAPPGHTCHMPTANCCHRKKRPIVACLAGKPPISCLFAVKLETGCKPNRSGPMQAK